MLAAILVAEIADVAGFPSAQALCSWAGLTPSTASQTPRATGTNDQARLQAGALGSDRGVVSLPRRPRVCVVARPDKATPLPRGPPASLDPGHADIARSRTGPQHPQPARPTDDPLDTAPRVQGCRDRPIMWRRGHGNQRQRA